MAKRPKNTIVKAEAKQLDMFAPVEAHAERIDKAKIGIVKNVLLIGAELAKAHEKLANHSGGTFGQWVEERCGISRMSASRYMQVQEVFGKTKCCNKLLQYFDDSAMYLLAAPSTPREALDASLERADAGEKITHKIAKEIVAEFKPDPTEKPFVLKDAEEALIDTVNGILEEWPEEHIKSALHVLKEISRGVV